MVHGVQAGSCGFFKITRRQVGFQCAALLLLGGVACAQPLDVPQGDKVESSVGPAKVADTAAKPASAAAKSASTSASSSKLSKENFEQIHNGMSEQDVVDILGSTESSSSSKTTSSGQTNTTRTLVWKEGVPYVMITVTFRNGEVSGKNRVQRTPVSK